MRPARRGATSGAPATKTKTKKRKKKAEDKSGATASAAVTAPRSQADEPCGPRTSLGAGLVSPYYARIDWASLLRRTYLDDVRACPCGGRRHVLADIHQRISIVAILTHLGLDPHPPPIARARDPTDDAA